MAKEREAGEARLDGAHLRTPDGHALPRVLDRAVTMELVQRYVETERHRNRRVMVWFGTMFLLVVLLVLVIFVSVGVFMLGNSRKAVAVAEQMREKTKAFGMELGSVIDRVGEVEDTSEKINVAFVQSEDQRKKKDETLKHDLSRFSRWVASNNQKDAGERLALNSQLKRMEEMVALSSQRYSELVASVATLSTSRPPRDAAASEPAGRPAESAAKEAPEPSDRAASSDLKIEEPDPDDEFAMELKKPDRARQSEISVVVLPNGDKYEGEFKDGLFHGWGIYIYKNGDRYEGEFEYDMRNGKGTMAHRNGDRYVGEFKNDMKSGRGSFCFANGDRYVGEFANDMINGRGTTIHQNGNRYSGEFRNGLKSGNGKFTFANGDVYEGEFRNDVREGKGIYAFADGGKYTGEFANGRRHGHGRRAYPDGTEYVGEFKDGKKDGHGICRYPNGLQIKVQYKDDRLVKKG